MKTTPLITLLGAGLGLLLTIGACGDKDDTGSDGSTSDGGSSTDGGDSDGGSTGDGGDSDGGSTDGGDSDGGSTGDGGDSDGGSTGDGGDSDGGSTGDGGGEEGVFSPGTWSFALSRVVNDSCGEFEDDGDYPFELTLSPTGDDSFDLLEGTSVYMSCTLKGTTFNCGPNVEVDTSEGPTITETESISGSFPETSSAQAIEFQLTECSGDGCAELEAELAGTFPCTLSIELAGTRSE